MNVRFQAMPECPQLAGVASTTQFRPLPTGFLGW